jgi:zinc transport system substrate-binding protein
MGVQMRFRKIVAVLLCACVILGLVGCGDGYVADDGKLKIVCTTFPQYDWIRQIVGGRDDVELVLLLHKGEDMHSYQPTVEDMYKIATADLFVYVGGSSDQWVDSALKNVKNDNIKVVNMMETIGDAAKVEEIVEGMQDDGDDHDHDHEAEEIEYDEHMWLSISNAVIITSQLAEILGQIDVASANEYNVNAKNYIDKLNDLDGRIKATVAESSSKTLLFGDRFPFRYFTDEYGLEYYAAFPGCSAETDASFETVVYLAGKVDEKSLSTIYVIENSDGRVADAIRRNTSGKNQEIITLNSMQSVSDKDIAAGASYLGIMEENLKALMKGL